MEEQGPLSPNTRLETIKGKSIVVEKLLGEGGQGFVYKVNYDGEPKALKWYKNSGLGSDPMKFYENIKNNVMKGSPSKVFLWPEDMTEWTDGTFGYIMGLVPEEYSEITDYMLKNAQFNSFKTIIDAALKITSAYRMLHNRGYSYQDLNDGNFFIEPNKGKVLIVDNDNVAPDGVETGILGKPRYMAPEIVLNKSMPNSLSDRYSMSIILYLIFCLNHPLEGKRYLVDGFTDGLAKKLYGSEPIFIMDPNDDRNAPHPAIHSNSIQLWPMLPEYVKDIFLKAFSKPSFENPSSRPKELDWMNVLTRFRSDIVTCSCGNEVFTDNGQPTVCDSCGKMINVPFRFELNDYSIPALRGSRIYRGQVGVCDEKDFLKPLGLVVANKNNPQKLALKNKSGTKWYATTKGGKQKIVKPDGVIPLIDGVEFKVFGDTVKIRKNN